MITIVNRKPTPVEPNRYHPHLNRKQHLNELIKLITFIINNWYDIENFDDIEIEYKSELFQKTIMPGIGLCENFRIPYSIYTLYDLELKNCFDSWIKKYGFINPDGQPCKSCWIDGWKEYQTRVNMFTNHKRLHAAIYIRNKLLDLSKVINNA